MKQVEIGDKSYQLCENVNDFYDIRFPVFLSYLRMSAENIDKPLFAARDSKANEWLNKGMPYNAVKEYKDYGTSITLDQVSSTGLSMCFALICIAEGEDQADVDEGKIRLKLEEMQRNGLDRGFVEESVRNFMKESPDSFGEYMLLMEMLRQMMMVS